MPIDIPEEKVLIPALRALLMVYDQVGWMEEAQQPVGEWDDSELKRRYQALEAFLAVIDPPQAAG